MTNNIFPNTNTFYHNIATRHNNYLNSHPDTTEALIDLFDYTPIDTILDAITSPIDIFHFFSILHMIRDTIIPILLDEPEHPYYTELSDYFNFLTSDLILPDFYN